MTSKKPQTQPRPGNEFLSDLQLSNRYGVHRGTIHRWARDGDFPKPIKLAANCTRWPLTDIEAWEEAKKESR